MRFGPNLKTDTKRVEIETHFIVWLTVVEIERRHLRGTSGSTSITTCDRTKCLRVNIARSIAILAGNLSSAHVLIQNLFSYLQTCSRTTSEAFFSTDGTDSEFVLGSTNVVCAMGSAKEIKYVYLSWWILMTQELHPNHSVSPNLPNCWIVFSADQGSSNVMCTLRRWFLTRRSAWREMPALLASLIIATNLSPLLNFRFSAERKNVGAKGKLHEQASFSIQITFNIDQVDGNHFAILLMSTRLVDVSFFLLYVSAGNLEKPVSTACHLRNLGTWKPQNARFPSVTDTGNGPYIGHDKTNPPRVRHRENRRGHPMDC